jgi:hypothetical protein
LSELFTTLWEGARRSAPTARRVAAFVSAAVGVVPHRADEIRGLNSPLKRL